MTTHAFPLLCKRVAAGVAASLLVLSSLTAAPMLRVINTDADTDTSDPITAVPALVPVGKTLIYPISAYSDEGQPLDFTVTSDNPKIFARVRTGNPLLEMTVSHEAGDDPESDPAYTGTLVFQLFRDWTPLTTGFIGGFAQSGFYNDVIFHRIADLTAGSGESSFIYQGGDRGTLPGFNFDNEFQPPLIFTGRGQLAMANAGDNQTLFNGTNNSQFFITQGNEPAVSGGTASPGGPRHLDFNHTIFAQLTHGWDVLNKLRHTPFTSSTPDSDVVITSTKVVAQHQTAVGENGGAHLLSDAHLVLSAKAPGTATITVRVSDGQSVTTKSFTVSAFDDEVNAPPFFVRPKNTVGPINPGILTLPLPKAIDLEYDYPIVRSGLIDTTPHAASDQPGSTVRVQGASGYTGPVRLAFGVTQFDPSYRGAVDGGGRDFDDRASILVGIGDKTFALKSTELFAEPAAALTDAAVATLVDTNPGGGLAAFTSVKINWGDGTPIVNGTLAPDFTRPVFGASVVRGTHTFAKEGVYTVTVDVARNRGFATTARSTVVVTSQELKAVGKSLDVRGAKVVQRVVATFSDATPSAKKSYLATIDWGDGKTSAGVVKKAGASAFAVLGTHVYSDPEDFSVSVKIHEINTTADQDALAWSRVSLSGFKAQQYLPPFDQTHLIGEISSIASTTRDPSDPSGQTFLPKPLRVTTGSGTASQTYFTCSVLVLNSGNVTSKPGTLRLYLSRDNVLNTSPTATEPRDIQLVIGTAALTQTTIRALKPGQSLRFTFDNLAFDTRLRPPPGETGTGLSLLAHMDYSDPLADHEPIAHDIVVGPFNGITVSPTSITTTEAGGQGTFTVKIDQAPAPNQVLVLNVASSNITAGTVSPSMLTFTASNWQTPQQVIVTGVDNDAPSGSTSYRINITVNATATTDPRFALLDPADVQAVNLDDEPKIIVSPTTLMTSENGTSASFSVKLDKQPPVGMDVTIPITNTDTTEGTLSTASLVFDSTNYSTPQTVTVTGKPDGITDGNIAYKINVGPSTSSAPQFNGAVGAAVTVTNVNIN